MQTYHEKPAFWPVPMGEGVLLEIEFTKVESLVALLNGNLRNLPVARVRAVSPYLSDEKAALITTSRKPGDMGERVLISESNLIYLRDEEYAACGLTKPTPENGLGDLATADYNTLIAIVSDDMNNPFKQVLGARVFFEFDYDDESDDLIESESGLLLREKDVAATNQMATVTHVGALVRYVKPGDRIIAPLQAASVQYGGKTYYYVTNEHEIISVLQPA